MKSSHSSCITSPSSQAIMEGRDKQIIAVEDDFCIFEEIQNSDPEQSGMQGPSSSSSSVKTGTSQSSKGGLKSRCMYWGYSDHVTDSDRGGEGCSEGSRERGGERSRGSGREGDEGLEFDAREGA